MDSILERIAKVFTAIIAWIQSLFCCAAEKPSQPERPTPAAPIPPGPQPAPPPQVAPVAPIPPVPPVDRTQQCLRFYRGEAANVDGRTLAQIWAWDDNHLETGHDLAHKFIQWLFPNHLPSAVNPQAPILNDAIIQAFRNEPLLRNNLLTSFNRMLRFYGLQLDEVAMQITRAPNSQARQAVWLINPAGHHNYLRMTRIIICLHSLGFPQHARAFYEILNDIAQHEGQQLIPQHTVQIWRNAARA